MVQERALKVFQLPVPINIKADTGITLSIKFIPLSSGSKVTALQIYHNAENSPTIIMLSGYGYTVSTLVENNNQNEALTYNLKQNYPNPFNPTTNIEFSIPKEDFVTLEIFNTFGIRIKTLLMGKYLKQGLWNYTWDAKDDNGYPLASGTYFIRLLTKNYIKTQKMILMK